MDKEVFGKIEMTKRLDMGEVFFKGRFGNAYVQEDDDGFFEINKTTSTSANGE